jgi:hypothetical protein
VISSAWPQKSSPSGTRKMTRHLESGALSNLETQVRLGAVHEDELTLVAAKGEDIRASCARRWAGGALYPVLAEWMTLSIRAASYGKG